jgi:hypothetical protein
MGPVHSCPTEAPCPICQVCPVLPQINLTGLKLMNSVTKYIGSLNGANDVISVDRPDPSGNIGLYVFDSASWTAPDNWINLNAHVSVNVTSNTTPIRFQIVGTEFNLGSPLPYNASSGLYSTSWNPPPIPLFNRPITIQFMVQDKDVQPTVGSFISWNITITVY